MGMTGFTRLTLRSGGADCLQAAEERRKCPHKDRPVLRREMFQRMPNLDAAQVKKIGAHLTRLRRCGHQNPPPICGIGHADQVTRVNQAINDLRRGWHGNVQFRGDFADGQRIACAYHNHNLGLGWRQAKLLGDIIQRAMQRTTYARQEFHAGSDLLRQFRSVC